MDEDAALDKLYGVSLDEFTATRNALAKELGGAAGARVKSLKKPNIAAWTINQLARTHPDDVKELFDVTDKVRRAQRRVLSGGKASDLRKATDDRNKVSGRLTKLAEKILKDAGHAASASTLADVRDSFVAVASDDAGADLLKKGRLTRELEPGSVLDVGGLALVQQGTDEEAAEEDEPQRDRKRLQEARRERDAARAALKSAREASKKANNEATRLEIEADDAAKRAKAAQEKAEFARRAADARRADVEAAEKAAEEADKAVRDAGN